MTKLDEEFIPITDMASWKEFLAANDDLTEIADRDTLLQLALNCELVIGGGAAPLFRVGFVD